MSDGSPVGANFMRQRHSWGYDSGGEDLEDDASSKPQPSASSNIGSRSWIGIMENVIWIASAVFIVYFGDWQSNFIYVLCHDNRIRRIPLYLGFFSALLGTAYFLYTSLSTWAVTKSNKSSEILGSSALPVISLLGLASFCLFAWALWPIWSFLTVPLVFTLFMACAVVSPYFISRTFKSQSDVLCVD